jgi:ribonuclease HI
VKLNVDGSFVEADGGLAGAGMILRDNNGNIVFSACRSILHCSRPLQAELLACEEGLSLALQWSTLPVDIEMDYMDAVKLIKSSTLDRSPHRMIVQDIKRLLGERDINIAHVSRNQNAVSHTLAAFGRSEGRTAVWLRSDCALDLQTFLCYVGTNFPTVDQ